MTSPFNGCSLKGLRLLSVLGVSLVHAAGPQDQTIPFSAEQMNSLGITLVAPLPATAATGGELTARVIADPDGEWIVAAQSDGVVVRLPVSEGDTVAAGSVLVELRSAEAPQMAADLIQAESAARLAVSERDRDRSLHSEGIIAARRVQSSEQMAAQAEARLAAARMRFKLIGLSMSDARAGRMLARAPAASTVLERFVTLGQRVNEADPLLRLVDADKLMLELQVPVASADFKVGDKLALPDGRAATVKQTGWGTNAMAQTVRVRAALPSGSSGARPGQWMKVQRLIVLSAEHSGWIVPASAISRDSGNAFVFLRVPQGFRAVPVEVLGSRDGKATVQGSLSDQSPIAASGTIAIKGAWLGHGGIQ